MLAEWLTYLLTPCPSHLRRMGYLREIIGTRSRYGRCHQAWASHLENTRKSILTAVKSVDSPETAVILGSGLLFDVPLTELSQAFANVVLVDIFHMPSVRRSAARYPNVTLIAHDLSGTVNRLSKAGPIRFVPTPSGNLPGADVDLLISANVLSQLPHLPSLFLAQVRPDVSETALQEFAASIVRHHLSQL